jgi:hypothetical protein
MIQPHTRAFFDQNLVLVHRVNWTDLDYVTFCCLGMHHQALKTAYVSSFISHSSSDSFKTNLECRNGALIVRSKKHEKFLGTKLETEIKIFYVTPKVPFVCCAEP